VNSAYVYGFIGGTWVPINLISIRHLKIDLRAVLMGDTEN